MENSSNKQDFTSRSEEIKGFLTLILSQQNSYHDHKEKMAHAGILVMLALTTAVIGQKDWPPGWVPDIHIGTCFFACKRLVTYFGLLLFWVFIHAYVRWQLRNRRSAAIYVCTLNKLLRDWAYKIPSNVELKPYENEKDLNPLNIKFPKNSKLSEFIDRYILPLKEIIVPTDEGMKGYPAILVAKIIEARTGATTGELRVSLASIFMLLIMSFRAFFQ
jgi:hypothetical protein